MIRLSLWTDVHVSVDWGMGDTHSVVLQQWRNEGLPVRVEPSPPHVLVVEMGSGCWKVGCRSSRSLAAAELLWEQEGNKDMDDEPLKMCPPLSSKGAQRRQFTQLFIKEIEDN